MNDPGAVERARLALRDGRHQSRGEARWGQQWHCAEDQGGNGSIVSGPYTVSAYLFDLSTIDPSELFYTDIERHAAQGDPCRTLYATPPPPKAFAPVVYASAFKEPQLVATGWGVFLLRQIRRYNKKRP